MLTQHEVRTQLDTIANEVAQTPGLYYELYSRLFSRRVQGWIQTAPQPDARVIQHIAENDPDYLIHIDTEMASINAELVAAQSQHPMQFNPAWDMDY